MSVEAIARRIKKTLDDLGPLDAPNVFGLVDELRPLVVTDRRSESLDAEDAFQHVWAALNYGKKMGWISIVSPDKELGVIVGAKPQLARHVRDEEQMDTAMFRHVRGGYEHVRDHYANM